MSKSILDLCKDPWNVWCDIDANWENDQLFLPGEFKLEDLPINPPTIGWEKMYTLDESNDNYKLVWLPTTIEEHFWAKKGLREYEPIEYSESTVDKQVFNGNYKGVSWWWRNIYISSEHKGRRVVIKFSGARLRAEVFLNEQLVGYNIIAEVPFEVDITKVIKIGEDNRLCVRITNPGGRMDWPDFHFIKQGFPHFYWGERELPLSHGFGGLDEGITLSAYDSVFIKDLFIKNTQEITRINAQITLVNNTPKESNINLIISVSPYNNNDKIDWIREVKNIVLKPDENILTYPISIPFAEKWDLETPKLYTLKTVIELDNKIIGLKEEVFGFRWFEVRELGGKPKFYLNGKRIVLRSAISWGFWPLNGLFPTEEYAEKEVIAAKKIGLNMLSFHRNIGKTIVLKKQDEIGLLRHEEPGAGCYSWSDNEWARKYELEKIRRMTLRDRNHPSLIIYCIQNEQVNLPPTNSLVREVMNMVHQLDPTRIVILKSAWSGEAPELMGEEYSGGMAFFLPYDDTYYHDDGTGWSGWFDQHTVGGPDVYREILYSNPENFSHRTENKNELVYWGETLGVGTLDRLDLIHSFYQENKNIKGYNKFDHEEWFTAYEKFLQEKDFKSAFPTVGDLVISIGNKSYYFWGRMIENIRICNDNDGLAISGWESIPIENHCGLVDVFRNFKGNPDLISYYNRPLHLAVKSRCLVLETGQSLITDIFVVNEVGLSGNYQLRLKVIDPDLKIKSEQSWIVNLKGKDTYGQLLCNSIVTKDYDKPGYYILESSIISDDKVVVQGKEMVFVVDLQQTALSTNGAVLESDNHIQQFLLSYMDVKLPNYTPDLQNIRFILIGNKYPSNIEPTILKQILNRIKNEDLSLLLLANDRYTAEKWADVLANQNVISFKGTVGPARGSWMGGWYFVKEHGLFNSLPVNTAMNWEYQADVRGLGDWWSGEDVFGGGSNISIYGGDGLIIEGDNIDHIVGYGRDHDRNLGTAVALINYGKGKIVLNSIAGCYDAIMISSTLATPVARRFLCNFLSNIK